jgi:hypothetical protein
MNITANTTKNAVVAMGNRFVDTDTIFLSPITMMPPEQAGCTFRMPLFTQVRAKGWLCDL